MRSFYLPLLSFVLILCSGCQTLQKKEVRLTHLKSPESVRLVSPRACNPSHLGYVLYDPLLQKTLESQNEDQGFIPASTQKLATTVAALKILGSDYRFKTTLSYRGVVKKGVLYGDLYLKGYGDPFLEIRGLIRLQEKMKFKKMVGRFFYDESFLVSEPFLNPSFNTWAPYNPGISALSFNFNEAYTFWKSRSSPGLSLKPGLSSEVVLYSVPDFLPYLFSLASAPGSPETHFTPKNVQRLDSENDLANEPTLSRLAESKEVWEFHPTSHGTSRLPVRSPGRLTAQVFSKLCELKGIQLPEAEVGEEPRGSHQIAAIKSTKLSVLVSQTLEYSNNLAAELIGLVAAREGTKRKMTIQETSDWLSKAPFSKKRDSFERNQSGLSARVQSPPYQLIAALEEADQLKLSEGSFESLLPVSGFNDGIRARLSSPDLAFRIRAKTGSAHYVKALAGYLYSKTGRRLMFAILQTEFEKRQSLNLRPDLPLGSQDLDDSQGWRKEAELREEAILTGWVQNY